MPNWSGPARTGVGVEVGSSVGVGVGVRVGEVVGVGVAVAVGVGVTVAVGVGMAEGRGVADAEGDGMDVGGAIDTCGAAHDASRKATRNSRTIRIVTQRH